MFWYLWKTVKILKIKPDIYILTIMDKISSIPPNPKLLLGCLRTLPENIKFCINRDLHEAMSLIK